MYASLWTHPPVPVRHPVGCLVWACVQSTNLLRGGLLCGMCHLCNVVCAAAPGQALGTTWSTPEELPPWRR